MCVCLSRRPKAPGLAASGGRGTLYWESGLSQTHSQTPDSCRHVSRDRRRARELASVRVTNKCDSFDAETRVTAPVGR